MRIFRCKACGGVYWKDQPGGYYHVCPPLDPEDPASFRPGHRDENVIEREEGKIEIISEGAGAEELKEVPKEWIKIKEAIEKRSALYYGRLRLI